MSTATIADTPVELNEEGFFVDPAQWTEAMADELARREGINQLTSAHWTVIRFMRSEYLEKGTGPTVRVLGKIIRRLGQRAVRAVSQRSGKGRSTHRRNPQAAWLHLKRSSS